MSGTLTPCGVVSVGMAVPGMGQLLALLEAAQAAAKLEIQGKLSGLGNVSAALAIPPLPGVVAAAAAKAAVQLALNPSVAAPSLQVAANASIVGELTAKLGGLVGLPDFGLGAFGVAAYKYQGSIDSLGPSVATALGNGLPGGSGTDEGYGVLLVATEPAAIAALRKVLL